MKSKFKGSRLEQLFNDIKDMGGTVYLVGGVVRNEFLGLELFINQDDIDIEVHGLSINDYIELLSHYGIVDCSKQNYGMLRVDTFKNCDFSTPRTESKNGNGHNTFDVKIFNTLPLELASSRRDFTVNSIYYDYFENQYIDLYNGIKDCTNRILNSVNEVTFKDDYLRIFRAGQLISRFDFQPTVGLIDLCKLMKRDDYAIDYDLIRNEFYKLLRGNKIIKGLQFYQDIGWINTKYSVNDVDDFFDDSKESLMYLYHLDQSFSVLSIKMKKRYDYYIMCIQKLLVASVFNENSYMLFMYQFLHTIDVRFIKFLKFYNIEISDKNITKFMYFFSLYGFDIIKPFIQYNDLVSVYQIDSKKVKNMLVYCYKMQLEGKPKAYCIESLIEVEEFNLYEK